MCWHPSAAYFSVTNPILYIFLHTDWPILDFRLESIEVAFYVLHAREPANARNSLVKRRNPFICSVTSA